MKRREFMALLVVAAAWQFAARSSYPTITLLGGSAAWPRTARAQQSGTAKLPGIGILSNGAGEHDLSPLIAGVFTELQRLDWVNGRTAIYEPRFAAGDPSRWPVSPAIWPTGRSMRSSRAAATRPRRRKTLPRRSRSLRWQAIWWSQHREPREQHHGSAYSVPSLTRTPFLIRDN